MTVAGAPRLGHGTVPAWGGAGEGTLFFNQADGLLYYRRSDTGVVVGPISTGGGGGITELTDDVTAGPGSGSQAATVVAIQGTPIDALVPNTGDVLSWDGAKWISTVPFAGALLVFRPGGTAVDNVYTTWSTFYTAALAVVAASGTVFAVIDTTFGVAEVAAGAFDFTNWRFIGSFPGIKTTLTFLNTANWTIAAFMGPTFEATDIAFELEGGATTSAISSPVGSGGSLRITLRNSSILGLVGDAFIDAKANGGGSQFTVFIEAYGPTVLNSFAINLDDSDPGSGSNARLYLYDTALVIATAITGVGGYLELHQENRGATIRTQPGFAGNQVFKGQATPHNWPMNESQLGTTELHIGSIYLYDESILRSVSTAMLGGAVITDTGTLKLRRFTGGTLIATWTVTGTLQDVPLGGANIIITAEDWYDLYLVAGGVAETAVVKGLRLFIHEPGGVS